MVGGQLPLFSVATGGVLTTVTAMTEEAETRYCREAYLAQAMELWVASG